MIKERIFRLHRHKSSSPSQTSTGTDASRQKCDFTFSSVQVLQVPKGLDKVSVSLISTGSGKTIHISRKAVVRNGTSKWTDTFSASICVSDNDQSSKEMDGDYIFKFLVLVGCSRPSILGEVSLNLVAFIYSESPILVTLPLKKCNYGTLLQVEVRCLTPRTNLRDDKWKKMHAHQHESSDEPKMENRSEKSDGKITKRDDSCSRHHHIGNSSRRGELGSRETSFSASVSRYSFESMDDFVGTRSYSSPTERNENRSLIGRQDLSESEEIESFELLREAKICKIQNGFEEEIKFKKEANENLSSLLKRTQESNIELISVFQEMEETIGKQKLNIQRLVEENLELTENNRKISRIERERDIRGETSIPESKVEDKLLENEIEQDLRTRVLKEFVVECGFKLTEKERKLQELEAALSRALSNEQIESQKLEKIESHKLDNKHKLSEMQKKCVEARKSRDCHCNNCPKSVITEPESNTKLSKNETFWSGEKTPKSQNEVLALRVSLKEIKFQTRLLEASLESILGDYAETKCENISMSEKNSGNLIARDALIVENVDMENELNRMKIANGEYETKVKQLEDIRQHLESSVQSLEEELKISKLYSEARRYEISSMDNESRSQLLGKQLEKVSMADDMHNSYLESAISVASDRSKHKEIYGTTQTKDELISKLEADLCELRERYLDISLKYAEVEAQREQLVMKLKMLNG